MAETKEQFVLRTQRNIIKSEAERDRLQREVHRLHDELLPKVKTQQEQEEIWCRIRVNQAKQTDIIRNVQIWRTSIGWF